MERVTRRGLIKALGSAAATLGLSKKVVAETVAVSREKEALSFRFTCYCGDEIVAPVPSERGQKFNVTCNGCHAETELTWKGTHFGMKTLTRGDLTVQNLDERTAGFLERTQLDRETGVPYGLLNPEKIWRNDDDEEF